MNGELAPATVCDFPFYISKKSVRRTTFRHGKKVRWSSLPSGLVAHW